MATNKIKSFRNLEAWRSAHELALSIYQTTEHFPKQEQFGLTNQMRRAAVSVSSNIAEGFSRFSLKDKSQFYTIAKGSLTELENQLLLSRDIGFLQLHEYEKIENKMEYVGKLLTGLLRFTRNS